MGIGPSTKETSLHYFRDPVSELLDADDANDFVGVIVVGTPQDDQHKHLVGKRVAHLLKAMDIQGAIVSTDGWGNSDIDFINMIDDIEDEAILTVGLKFIGTQASFVVEPKSGTTIFDINKSIQGVETQVVGENTIDEIDARKALAALKIKQNHRK